MELSDTKKRPVPTEPDSRLFLNPLVCEDEDEDEDKKVERFYELIKNIREARSHLMKRQPEGELLNGMEFPMRKKQKLQAGGWVPCFLREDFMEAEELHQLKISGASSMADLGVSKKEDEEKKESQELLDLRLSL